MKPSPGPSRDQVLAELARQRSAAGAALAAAGSSPGEVAALLEAGREAIGIRIRPARAADLRPGATRLGGLPDLPAGVPWPEGSGGGEPSGGRRRGARYVFDFVGQLRLEEIAPFDVRDQLPHEGLLSFFVGHDLGPEGGDAELAHRVDLHLPGVALRQDPGDTATRPRHLRPPRPRGVTWVPVFALPPPWSLRSPDTTTGAYEAAWEAIYRPDEPVLPFSGLLGFDRPRADTPGPGERMLLRLEGGEGVPYLLYEAVNVTFVFRDGPFDLGTVRVYEGAQL